jgi:hypothetical protein
VPGGGFASPGMHLVMNIPSIFSRFRFIVEIPA